MEIWVSAPKPESSFSPGPPRGPRNLLRLEENITDIWLRLANVQIENLSWKELITRYDKPGNFFYLDPPYYGCPDYMHNFEPEDFEDLAKHLANIGGKFMLSINDRPEVREIFKEFCYKEVSLLYTVGQEKPVKANELIYANYELKEAREPNLLSE